MFPVDLLGVAGVERERAGPDDLGAAVIVKGAHQRGHRREDLGPAGLDVLVLLLGAGGPLLQKVPEQGAAERGAGADECGADRDDRGAVHGVPSVCGFVRMCSGERPVRAPVGER
ncbi:hypothetical protein [Kitasatospora sp. NBC_01300]|uniref:hypothetical protein n=1 Tax=Kitasatospora sp. NBC_01300 TaxID=2903574 RepID=UPI002F90B955|nr:hypothetical protein OG556_40040 [Kitasatospora sp. NBC_01300]